MRISDVMLKLAELKREYGDLRVGYEGFFGEFYELGDNDIRQDEVNMEDPMTVIKKERIVELTMPYLGEEPD